MGIDRDWSIFGRVEVEIESGSQTQGRRDLPLPQKISLPALFSGHDKELILHRVLWELFACERARMCVGGSLRPERIEQCQYYFITVLEED